MPPKLLDIFSEERMNVSRLKNNTYTQMTIRTVEEIVRIDLLAQSASLAFYAALSLAPLLLLTLNFLAVIDPQLESDLIREITNRLGDRAAEVVSLVIESSKSHSQSRSFSNITGLVTLLISSSAVFIQLKTTLINILDKELPSPTGSSVLLFLKDRVFAILMVLTFVIASAASLVATLSINYIAPTGSEFFLHQLNRVLTFITFTLIFYGLYQLVPRSKRSKTTVFSFAAVSSLFFLLGTHLIGRYLSQSAIGSSYGAAGSLIVLLAWVYYSSFIVYILAIALDVFYQTRTQQNLLNRNVLNETDMV